MANGHPYAARYPIGRVFRESEFVVERLNNQEISRAVFIQLAVASGMGSKKATKLFNKQIEKLQGK